MQILSTNVSIFFLSFLPPFHLYNFFFFLSFRFRSFLIFIYFLKRHVENSLHKALDVNLLERLKKCVSIFYLNGMRNCVVLNVPSIFILNECNWVKLLVFFSAVFIFFASTSVHLHAILKFNTKMYNIFFPFSINYAPIFTAKLIKKFSTPIFISLSPFSRVLAFFFFLFLNSIYLLIL